MNTYAKGTLLTSILTAVVICILSIFGSPSGATNTAVGDPWKRPDAVCGPADGVVAKVILPAFDGYGFSQNLTVKGFEYEPADAISPDSFYWVTVVAEARRPSDGPVSMGVRGLHNEQGGLGVEFPTLVVLTKGWKDCRWVGATPIPGSVTSTPGFAADLACFIMADMDSIVEVDCVWIELTKVE